MFNTYSNRTTFNVPRLFEEEKNNDTISLNIAVLLFIFISNCARFRDCYEKKSVCIENQRKTKIRKKEKQIKQNFNIFKIDKTQCTITVNLPWYNYNPLNRGPKTNFGYLSAYPK